MNREELAWAGGLFEGEGCFTSGGKRKTAAKATVAMTDLDALERFQRATGLGHITGPYVRGRQVPIYFWQVLTFPRTQALVAMLWPWLGERRRARAKEVLLKDDTRPGRPGRRPQDPLVALVGGR